MTFPGIFPITFFKTTGGIIQSIQQVSITIATGNTSNTATITSVDTSKAIIIWGGFNDNNTGSAAREVWPRIELTNGTTVTAFRNTSSASFTVTVKATVVEFISSAVSSIQRGTIALSSVQTSNTATISSVTTSRSIVLFLGGISDTLGQTPTNLLHHITLTDATTVTIARNAAGGANMTFGYEVVEFAASVIQSVQPRSRVLTSSSTSDTDTITGVTVANTMLIWNGILTGSTGWGNGLYYINLTNSTTVTLTRTGTATTSRTIKYTVLEFVSGVLDSVQEGSTALGSGVTSADTTISSVTTSKTVSNYLGHMTTGTALNSMFGSTALLDATNMRSQRGASNTDSVTTGWEAVEFL